MLWTQTNAWVIWFNITNASQSPSITTPYTEQSQVMRTSRTLTWNPETREQMETWLNWETIFPYGKTYCIHADKKVLTCSCVFSLWITCGSNPSWTLRQYPLWGQQGTAPHHHRSHCFFTQGHGSEHKEGVSWAGSCPSRGLACVCDICGCAGSRRLSFEYQHTR